jgi:hypothetical protein
VSPHSFWSRIYANNTELGDSVNLFFIKEILAILLFGFTGVSI